MIIDKFLDGIRRHCPVLQYKQNTFERMKLIFTGFATPLLNGNVCGKQQIAQR